MTARVPIELSEIEGRSLLFGTATFLFYLFVFFPYLGILPLGSDTQPNAVLVGLLVLALACRDLRLPRECWALGLLALMAVAVFMLDAGSFAAARGLFGYVSLFVVSATTYVSVRNGYTLKSWQIHVFLFAWLALGLAQTIIGPDFGTALSSAARTTEGRGVVSFAVEPGYYASMMFFVLLFLMVEKREFSLAGLLCVFQIVFLAQSTMALVALVIPVAVYAILKIHVVCRTYAFWIGIAVLLILSPSIIGYFEDSRIKVLFELLVENPALLVIVDASGNQRAASIFISISGAFDNYLIPRGFNAYLDYVRSAAWEFRNIFPHLSISDRIMSGYGAALFELGVFGFILPVVITIAIFRHFGRAEWQRAVVLNAAVHAILFTALPLALPAIGFLIGHLLASPNCRLAIDRRLSEAAPAPAAET